MSVSEHKSSTWFPEPPDAAPNLPVAPADVFLKDLGGRIRPLLCGYEGSRLLSARPFVSGKLEAMESLWSAALHVSDGAEADGQHLDLSVTFTINEGAATSAGVAVAFDFSGWSPGNYILVPAQLYGGNRFRILPIGYPPYVHNKKDRPLDMPITTTNILHLNRDGSHAKVEMNTGNVATPMMSFFNPKEKRGFILLAEQGTRFGNNGLIVEEDAGPAAIEKRLTFVVSAPGVREQRYKMCGRAETNDRGADWKAGDELVMKCKLFNFTCAGMEAFYEKVFNVRKALSGPNSFDCVTPYSHAADLILDHHNATKWFETEKEGRYAQPDTDAAPYWHNIGWGGMPIFCFQQVIAETPERLRRVGRTLDAIFEAQATTGLFHAIYREGVLMGDHFGKHAERPSIAMTRRSMDVLYFGLRSLALMKQRGHGGMVKPAWEKSLRACADGLVKVWNAYGQFGQFIDVGTAQMEINGSTAGCAASYALAFASRYFNEPKYLEAAEAATRMYHERDFLKGYAGGGAAEILQSPDSEAPWDMIESCMAIYDVTGKTEWVDRARFAMHMLSTWMVSYDYAFPPKSAMARAGTRATGSIFASSQNNHSAAGCYVLSGDFMLKLFRATGDARYAEMYRDNVHNITQYVGTPHGPLRRKSGCVTERVQLSDWEGDDMGELTLGVDYSDRPEWKEANEGGDIADSSMAWETVVALACLENPGIYLHTDGDTLLVLDHVEAKVLMRAVSGVTLELRNPTKADARVSIFAESVAQSKIPLGWGACDKWPGVEISSGAKKTVIVKTDGALT